MMLTFVKKVISGNKTPTSFQLFDSTSNHLAWTKSLGSLKKLNL